MTNSRLRVSTVTLFVLLGVLIIDQNIKMLFVDGFRYYSEYVDFILVYNKGVAFSMLAFLAEDLKYIQLVLVGGILVYIFLNNTLCYAFPFGLLLGGAISNVYDRFVHEGVVDMVYWHGWPYPVAGQNGFAVFNFADVMIDIAIVWIILLQYKPSLCKIDTENE